MTITLQKGFTLKMKCLSKNTNSTAQKKGINIFHKTDVPNTITAELSSRAGICHRGGNLFDPFLAANWNQRCGGGPATV